MKAMLSDMDSSGVWQRERIAARLNYMGEKFPAQCVRRLVHRPQLCPFVLSPLAFFPPSSACVLSCSVVSECSFNKDVDNGWFVSLCYSKLSKVGGNRLISRAAESFRTC